MTTVWIVEFYHDDRKDIYQYGLVGIFNTKEKALEACRTESHLLGPVEINKDFGDDRGIHPGAYYPHLETLEEGEERQQKQFKECFE